MKHSMPSPLGHCLAGLAVGIATDPSTVPSKRPLLSYLTRYAWLTACLAVGPDLDLLLHDRVIIDFHRTATHSFTAVAAVFIVTAFVTGGVTTRARRWWDASMCALAWSSHLFMDWLGADPSTPSGLKVFWPFSDRFYISGLGFFPATERDIHVSHFLVQNARAATVELCVGGILVAVALYINSRRAERESAAAVVGKP